MDQHRSTADVFRHSAELLQAGDLDGWLGLCDDNVVFELPFAPPGRLIVGYRDYWNPLDLQGPGTEAQ